jgi:hypothetical protein
MKKHPCGRMDGNHIVFSANMLMMEINIPEPIISFQTLALWLEEYQLLYSRLLSNWALKTPQTMASYI